MNGNAATVLRSLRLQWIAITAIFVAAAAVGGLALARLNTPRIELWLIACLGILAFQAVLSWRHLPDNAAPGTSAPRSSIGPANVLTLSRGLMIAMLGGFVAAPPQGELLSTAPALLYGSNLFIDVLDGAIARASGKRTILGEILEHELDSLGVLAATAFLVVSGRVAPWFILVGIVRYIFLAAIAFRKARGKRCCSIAYSRSGRTLAAMLMVFLLLALWPYSPASLIRTAALPVALLFLTGFARDWLVVIGTLHGRPYR